MSAVADLVTTAHELGATFEVTPERVTLRAPRRLPEGLVADLRQHKPEVIEYLSQQDKKTQRRYQQLYSGDGPGDAELADLELRVHEEGYVLCWSEVLDDYVAFHRDDVDPSTIPVGFVPYSEAELLQLFREGEPDFSWAGLRLVHQAKKTGATSTDVSPE